ncbi:hypothetical protein BSL82_05520 [Tardibacter chloracetimidivorans]|uniref:Uncharacterized protein n=1 Tax=Tardibacter chloracetimidivorans TaxID=1921510 RepID=A0A1L3ZT68_9SPHN|nr:hypothetical protein BSL82_05520 [Tardibacter chloracetimidivorans]
MRREHVNDHAEREDEHCGAGRNCNQIKEHVVYLPYAASSSFNGNVHYLFQRVKLDFIIPSR